MFAGNGPKVALIGCQVCPQISVGPQKEQGLGNTEMVVREGFFMEGDLAASWGQEVFVKNTWNRTGDFRELGTQVSGTRGHFDAHWQTGKYLKDFIFALSSQKMN